VAFDTPTDVMSPMVGTFTSRDQSMFPELSMTTVEPILKAMSVLLALEGQNLAGPDFAVRVRQF
jgi:hypothetical protein